MVWCGVLKNTDSAISLMPGDCAIAEKLGAALLGEFELVFPDGMALRADTLGEAVAFFSVSTCLGIGVRLGACR